MTAGGATATADWPCGCEDDKPPAAEKKADGTWATILKVVGAAATGITATGFIVVVGAVVFWVRFNEAGLPATQAVGLLARNELLAQGAQQTIVYLAIALGTVLLLYFADPRGTLARVSLLLLAGLTLLAIAYPITTDLSFAYVVLLGAGAVVLFAGCVVVGLRTDSRFWPLALAVFVATLAYTATVGLLVVKEQRFVQAMAVLRGDSDAGLVGVYIAVTDKSIYIGQEAQTPAEEEEEAEGREVEEKRAIVEVPREGAVYAVGPLDNIADAEERAPRMLEQLLANRERAGTKPVAEKPDATEAPAGPTGATGATGATGQTGTSGLTGATQETPKATETGEVVGVADAFGTEITVHRTVESQWDCLVRYGSAGAKPLGRWWTSCEEDEAKLAGLTVAAIRDELALPGRFQPTYDMRVKASLQPGSELVFLEGTVGAQCEYATKAPCGHRYPGSEVRQIYLPEPQQARILKRECTDARPDKVPVWDATLCFPEKP